MKRVRMGAFALGILMLAGAMPGQTRGPAELAVAYRTSSAPCQFAAGRLGEALGGKAALMPLANATDRTSVIAICGEAEAASLGLKLDPSVRKEGFQIVRKQERIFVLGRDESGAMYGLLDVAEQVRMHGGLLGVKEKISNPRFPFRAIKFNLPWSPYRPGPAADVHLETCRDLKFWQRFLDMMASNRFNALTLWNLHPFTYMVRPTNFPKACPLSDKELADWRSFWRSLFRMAKERGIETYIVNWNIVVSPEFAAAYGAKEYDDTSPLVRRYMRECITQVIDEYEDLTGLGVTLADWMGGLKPKEAEDFVEETFVAGMKNAKRPVKFIHRATLAGDPMELRRVIDHAALPDPVWVEIKFNWSHGHSTPRLAMTHDYESGKLDERFWTPAPTNYKIAWMVRNEDFFILRWGEPDFIRAHISGNGHDYVRGYFVGSEGYIPAKDYSHKPGPHVSWSYAFEKQWMFYMLWGRLMYDPQTPDAVFEAELDRRYGVGQGAKLLRAHTLASRMPLKLASFYRATWDFTLYSEGFLAPVKPGDQIGPSPFISIDELIANRTLDPTYLSIGDFISGAPSGPGLVSPLELAEGLKTDGREALKLVASSRPVSAALTGALECELEDIETWAYLSLYFADKLRAGTALETYRRLGGAEVKEKAVGLLERAAGHWDKVCKITSAHYFETPYADGESFSWEKYRPRVLLDIETARRASPKSFP
jgi:hypothetical protein